MLLYSRGILTIQLLQAASAGSNYYVSVPVKEIQFACVTLSSSPAYQLGRSRNVGLISVNREKREDKLVSRHQSAALFLANILPHIETSHSLLGSSLISVYMVQIGRLAKFFTILVDFQK